MRNFIGRIALFNDDYKALYKVASLGKSYVEIGTLFGGSACIAGLAGCEVFCIDPLDGYYSDKHGEEGRVDGWTDIAPSPEIVRGNWATAGLDPTRLHISQQIHPPWPDEIDRTFDVGLIDGDHRLDGVLADYFGMAHRVKYLMFHDCNKLSVRAVVGMALGSELWDIYIPNPNYITSIVVLERKHK